MGIREITECHEKKLRNVATKKGAKRGEGRLGKILGIDQLSLGRGALHAEETGDFRRTLKGASP